VPRAALALPPAWRRRAVLLLVLAAALAAAYQLWFRDSSFATVKNVEVSGLTGPQAKAIRAALVDAAGGMTTLHVRDAALRDAVARYPVVRAVTAQGVFPHLLRVQVDLNLPVALLQTGAGQLPVAADGLILRGVPLPPGLPLLAGAAAPAGARVTRGLSHALLRVVAGAPEALRTRITFVEVKAEIGLVAHLRNGPDLIFGDATVMDAKWAAGTRVLSSPAARGATYIDLRLPERPAAGGLPMTGVLPLAPAGSTQTMPVPTSTTPSPAPSMTGTTTTPAAATPGQTPTSTSTTQTGTPAPSTTRTTTTTAPPAAHTHQPATASPSPTAPAGTAPGNGATATPGGGTQASG
jgi:cell division protein FtsQ